MHENYSSATHRTKYGSGSGFSVNLLSAGSLVRANNTASTSKDSLCPPSTILIPSWIVSKYCAFANALKSAFNSVNSQQI